MAKIQRTFGWIQNPGELSKLRKVVASLCPNTSEHNDLVNDISYDSFFDMMQNDEITVAV